MEIHYSITHRFAMFSVMVLFVFVSVLILSAGAVPLVPDAASTVINIACSAIIPLANTPDLKNLQKCLAEHNKNSKTVIDVDSVGFDHRLRQLELYLPGEANGKTILINCQWDEPYVTTRDDDMLEFDCHMHAKLIVRGLIKNPTEAANKNRSTKECSQRSNLLCSSKECEDWVNCPYTEMELRPPDIDDVTLGDGCVMIGGKTSRWMYDACGKLDCLCCRPFSYYDSKTKSCKACTAGGLPYPSPPIADACKVASSNIMTSSTNFLPIIDTQISTTTIAQSTTTAITVSQNTTTATTVIQITSTATEKADLSTPGMHHSPYTTVKPGNSVPATDIVTDDHNRSAEGTTIALSTTIGILAIIGVIVGVLCYLHHRKYMKLIKKHASYTSGVRRSEGEAFEHSSISISPSGNQSTTSGRVCGCNSII